MAFTNTTRLAIRHPDLTQGADFQVILANLANDVDAKAAGFYAPGLLSARPAAGVGGMFYYATDTTTLYYDNGTIWTTSAPGTGTITSAMILDGTIATIDIAANAVTAAKVDQSGAFNFSAAGGLKAQSMRVHRHPYASDRHIESGSQSGTDSGGGASGSASFTDAYAAAPVVAVGGDSGSGQLQIPAISTSTSGFSWSASFGNGQFRSFGWISEGQD